ncbi:MAG: NAD(+) synthase [Lachnospiraceae bacterium]|nr:NAD(+) synthase [Lachnospiraceae bacterium]
MRHGFIKAAAVTHNVAVADVASNVEALYSSIKDAYDKGAKIIVTPELGLSGYTCQDLFLQPVLTDECLRGLMDIRDKTDDMDAVTFVGLPYMYRGKLYNVAAVLNKGRILGLIPKTHVPNYGEFYELRHFTPAMDDTVEIDIDGERIPFGRNLIFECDALKNLKIACEICEDLWAPNPPSVSHAMHGATVIVNLSASDETAGKSYYRRDLVKGQSGRLLCGYVYSSAGDGESTQDLVFSGHNIICENGSILSESRRFENGTAISEIDVDLLQAERVRMNTFSSFSDDKYRYIKFDIERTDTEITRFVNKAPFVPAGEKDRAERCSEILTMQAMGLKKRLVFTHTKTVTIGISGGLDSTLAFLVAAKAFDLAGLDRKGIVAVTMPGFGTTDRTYRNACELIKAVGATFVEIPIGKAVTGHFEDIGHDIEVHDVTYENCQARERTQILMDLAGEKGGFVVGTGDLSELALGWATYNGDHMSMYGVNSSIPKTLVRHLVRYCADDWNGFFGAGNTSGENTDSVRNILYDILDTPVSPELLPPENGKISQKTEELVGPYELHDFFLYNMLRRGFSPSKLFRLARIAFEGEFSYETIAKWLKVFFKRFFSQQFKRSCMPDGPKVGSVTLSPRGDLRMPSDAVAAVWLDELEAVL